MQQLPIFPNRHQLSIFGASELNFCVRYENRWDLTANVTAMVYIRALSHEHIFFCVHIVHLFELTVNLFSQQIHNCTDFPFNLVLFMPFGQISYI